MREDTCREFGEVGVAATATATCRARKNKRPRRETAMVGIHDSKTDEMYHRNGP